MGKSGRERAARVARLAPGRALSRRAWRGGGGFGRGSHGLKGLKGLKGDFTLQ